MICHSDNKLYFVSGWDSCKQNL